MPRFASTRKRRVYKRRAPVRRRKYASKRTNMYNMVRRGQATITGHGDYRVNKNSLMMGNDPPVFKNITKGGAVTICHREFIQNIVSAGSTGGIGTAFQNLTLRVQPGNEQTFPWLSQIAANFQEYEINGMVFEYKSLSSDAIATSNTSAALGDVIMASNYNPAAPAFSNSIQMLESEFSSNGKPSLSAMHPVECLRSQTPVSHLYVLIGSVPSGQDARLYDFSTFQIATEGCQATSALLGQLWVSYEITFYKPILNGNAPGNDLLTDKFLLTGPLSATPLGTSQTLSTGSTIRGSINGATGTTYTFPSWVDEGTFLVTYHVAGVVAASIVTGSINTSSGTTVLNVFASNAGGDNALIAPSPANGVSSVNYENEFIISIGANPVLPVTIAFSGYTLPTGAGFGDLIITQIAPITN